MGAQGDPYAGDGPHESHARKQLVSVLRGVFVPCTVFAIRPSSLHGTSAGVWALVEGP